MLVLDIAAGVALGNLLLGVGCFLVSGLGNWWENRHYRRDARLAARWRERHGPTTDGRGSRDAVNPPTVAPAPGA